MITDFFDAIETLNLPEGVAERLKQLRPPELPHRQVLLSRLSLLRTFNETGYQAATDGLDKVAFFAEFTRLPEIEALVGFPERFVIREAVRSELWRAWRDQPEERRRWGAHFARVLASGNEQGTEELRQTATTEAAIVALDRLQLWFLFDEATGCRELTAAFERADIADDLSACAALVQLVSEPIRLFCGAGSEAAALLKRLRARQQSRNLFYTEFYQTTDYFARRAVEAALQQFVDAKEQDRWILHLYATGGMGKTTLLRRLVSHEWVTSPRRLPCAWIDFDYLDVSTVLRAPWLLALPIAAQWNEQLDQPVFGALLDRSNQRWASLLFRERTDGWAAGMTEKTVETLSRAQYQSGRSNPMRCGLLAGAIPPESAELRKNLLQSAQELQKLWDGKFIQGMAEIPPEKPLVLILDTVEEASLQHTDELRALLLLIGRLRRGIQAEASKSERRAPQLKLILSGRHQLGVEHLPAFRTDFAGEYDELALGGFEDEEAAEFLNQRLAPRQHFLIGPMVRKSLGIPFNLSLFAEWAKEEPNLKKETVEQTEEISAVMLIERIIKRIPYQPLRWIIRYGVVPRSLSFEFLRDVMRQPLVDALEGKAAADGRDRTNSTAEKDVWEPEPDFAFDAERLWNDYVLQYASHRGWMLPGTNPHQVAFRSDIQRPMRKLLARQPIFEELHERAARWYGEQAKAPEKWGAAIVEHLYHRAQLRSVPGRPAEDLVPLLTATLNEATDAAVRRWLAQELCNEGFENLTPVERGYVEYRLAEAIAAQAGYSYVNYEARRHLAAAFEHLGNGPSSVFPEFAQDWKQAAAGAPVSLFLMRMSQVPPDDAVQLALLIADLAGTNSPLAADVLASALQMLDTLSRPTVPPCVVEEKLGRCLHNTEPERAAVLFTRAATGFLSLGEPNKASALLCEVSEVQLRLGRLTQAEAALKQALERVVEAGPPEPRFIFQSARLELAKGQPGEALKQLGALGIEGTGDVPALSAQESLDAAMLRTEALSQRMLWAEAQEMLQQARRLASLASQPEKLLRVAIAQHRLERWWLRRTGPYLGQLANQTVRSSEASSGSDELDVWTIYAEPETAKHRAFGELGGSSPGGRIRLILLLSQVNPEVVAARGHQLLTEIEAIPRSARFLLLVEPVLLGPPPTIAEDLRRSLAEAFKSEPEGEIECAWYAIRYGELLGWLGMHPESAQLLANHVPPPTQGKRIEAWRLAVYRERRRIEQRLRGWGATQVPPEPDPFEFWWSVWAHTPLRRAAAVLENAQRAFEAGDRALVLRSLEQALPVVTDLPFPNAFAEVARSLTQKVAETRKARCRPKTPVANKAILDVCEDFVEAVSTVRETLGDALLDYSPAATVEAPAEELPFQIASFRPQAGRLSANTAGQADVLLSAESQTLELLLRARGIPRRLGSLPLQEIAADLRDVVQQIGFDPTKRAWLRTILGPLSAAPWELAFTEELAPWRAPSGWRNEEIQRLENGWRKHEPHFEARPAPPPRELTGFVALPLASRDRESAAVDLYGRLADRLQFVPEPQMLMKLNREIRWLHVAGSFVELPSLSEPALAGWELGISQLAHFLQGGGEGTPKAVVVLDVPMVRSEPDLIHQLLMRNYCAQVLLDSGAVQCVIATGLCPVAVMAEIHDLLVGCLKAPTLTQAELFDRLVQRARVQGNPAHAALFSAYPNSPLAPDWPHHA